ncbi:hypothetical protein GCM10010320_44790 [Streptomyces caelestis]|nr:hypothetical protein GCM10010320_44790 [Streptomyces caelestis]
MTLTPLATSPAVRERTCALLAALPPPSTCTVRNGDWPCGEWLLTGVTWPGSWFAGRAVAAQDSHAYSAKDARTYAGSGNARSPAA